MVERLHHATLKLHRDPLARGARQPEGKTTRRQLQVWRPLRRRRNRELFLVARRWSVRTLTSLSEPACASRAVRYDRAQPCGVIAWAIIVHMHVRCGGRGRHAPRLARLPAMAARCNSTSTHRCHVLYPPILRNM
ncbi:hypothetical protein IQ07DRAFT_198431 [Pyrenochaeta sp. DS3sAY3a]|nr:hypothetical protein IQ07DRAFT_198431 [Pyrenochaeta sp. DS3sAY3a]